MRKASSLSAVMLALGVGIGHGQTATSSPGTVVTVYKQVGCGCCTIWAEHLRKAGFKVSSMEVPDLTRVKKAYGVPPSVQTCHTALVGDYVVEGHVPLDAIQKMLKERPKIAGIGVAGMPIGTPGMESGAQKDSYEVVAFDKNGAMSPYLKK